MKTFLSFFTICCLGIISSSTIAALNLIQIDTKIAAVISEDYDIPLNGFLSIPSSIDYIVEPTPPIIIGPVQDFGDGFDWIFVSYVYPEPVPIGPLATITIIGSEEFGGYNSEELFALTLWDETISNKIGSIVIIPEPTTFLLLGMGGLLIRKR